MCQGFLLLYTYTYSVHDSKYKPLNVRSIFTNTHTKLDGRTAAAGSIAGSGWLLFPSASIFGTPAPLYTSLSCRDTHTHTHFPWYKFSSEASLSLPSRFSWDVFLIIHLMAGPSSTSSRSSCCIPHTPCSEYRRENEPREKRERENTQSNKLHFHLSCHACWCHQSVCNNKALGKFFISPA